MAARAFVLLSGGIDSTTCLYQAMSDFLGQVTGVSVFYGQRHRKEIEHAERSCRRLGIGHHIIAVEGIIPKTLLTDPTQEVPNISYAEITGVSPAYVPYRNGVLLSVTTSYVAGEREKTKLQSSQDYFGEEWAIYFGAHAEDAHNWAYPDCTPEFIGSQANAIYTGSYHGIRLRAPLMWLMKPDIVKLGESLDVHWEDTWSCYAGGERHCGVCPTCRARRDGFIKAGVHDPTQYAGEGA